MHSATDAVALKLRHIQHLLPDSLTRERGIAMDQNRNDLAALHRVLPDSLAGARHAHHHGIYDFEMTRVGAQPHLHRRAARLHHAVVHIAEVIFHIAIAIDRIGDEVRIKLLKHQPVGFFQKLRDDRETSAMRHAHRDFLHAKARAVFDHRIERRDERLRALCAETLLPFVGHRVQESLERLHFQNVPQHPLLRRSIRYPLRAVFDAVAEPVAHPRICDVHELKTNVAAVDFLQLRTHLAKRHRHSAEKIFRADREIEILIGKAEFAQR